MRIFLSRTIRTLPKLSTDKYKKDDALPMFSIPIETNTLGSHPSLSQDEGESHNDEAVIIRTTSFTAVRSHGGDNVSRDQYNRQHPWVLSERTA
ncbi:hypothetical protein F4809DRAFT_616025 [Biscogniauxia mediterranea]|nr:hypothetical protein F4809DRAFT_616025 [Biscogniauxia mediterranea]